MVNRTTTILGISPGTRFTGIAVFRQGELIEYKTKTFTGKVSKKKLERIRNTMEEIIDGYAVDSIAIKIPLSRTKHKGVREIIAGIEEITRKKNLQLLKCNISDLKRVYSSDKKTTRKELAEYLMLNFPELSYIEHCGYNKHTYYGKMFEAIAAGMQYSTKP